MSLIEALLYTFSDSLMAALLVPIQGEVAVPALKIFHTFPLMLVGLTAFAGAVVGILGNYCLGVFFKQAFRMAKADNEGEGSVTTILKHIREKWYWLLALSCVPVFGSVMVVLMSVASVKFTKVMTYASASYAVYYVYYLS